MHVLVVGLGSIGRRHLANLRRIDPHGTVTVWHRRSRVAHADYPVPVDRVVFRLEDALAASPPECALITGPASDHIGVAMDLVSAGLDLLIEKPLSDALDRVDALIEACRSRQLTLLVGYNFRFHSPLCAMRDAIHDGRIGRVLFVRAEVGRYLPEWRGGIDYRNGVSASRALGGGVLLELSHEIDYVRWLAGEIVEVNAVVDRLSDLEIDVEDTAELTFKFASGAVGSVHLDMCQRAPVRSCRVAGTEGTLVWDGLSYEVRCYRAADGQWQTLAAAGDADRNDMYVAELEHFLGCVQRTASPQVSGEDGRRVLELVMAARHSALERRAVGV